MNNHIILEWSRHPKYNTEAQTIKEKTDTTDCPKKWKYQKLYEKT